MQPSLLTKAVYSARQLLLTSDAHLLYGRVCLLRAWSPCLHPFSAVLLNPSVQPHCSAACLQLRDCWHQDVFRFEGWFMLLVLAVEFYQGQKLLQSKGEKGFYPEELVALRVM